MFYKNQITLYQIGSVSSINTFGLKTNLDAHNSFVRCDPDRQYRSCGTINKHGANVNDNYECNHTSLHIAIGRKQLEIVKLLIKNGANVNTKTKNHDKDDLTPIHLAVFANTPEFVELLNNNGIIINERENTKASSLCCFIWK